MTIDEALDIFKCLAWHDLRPSEEEIEMAFKTLNDKPTGKWEIVDKHFYQCSNCKADSGFVVPQKIYYQYCPWCGASMKSEDKE